MQFSTQDIQIGTTIRLEYSQNTLQYQHQGYYWDYSGRTGSDLSVQSTYAGLTWWWHQEDGFTNFGTGRLGTDITPDDYRTAFIIEETFIGDNKLLISTDYKGDTLRFITTLFDINEHSTISINQWQMKIGDIAYDLVTNPHQIKASVYHSTRDVDSGSIVLNGFSDYAKFDPIEIGGDMRVSMRVKLDSITNWDTIWYIGNCGDNSNNGDGVYIRSGSNTSTDDKKTLVVTVEQGTTTNDQYYEDFFANELGNWVHIEVTFSASGETKVYKNSLEFTRTRTAGGTNYVVPTLTRTKHFIGRHGRDGYYSRGEILDYKIEKIFCTPK